MTNPSDVVAAGPIGPSTMNTRGVRTHVPGLWEAAIAEWVIHLRAGDATKETIYTSRQRLERTARHIRVADPWSVTGKQLKTYFGTQVAWSRETRRGHRTSLRSFYGWGVEEGYIGASPALALPSVKPSDPMPMPVPDEAYVPALACADARELLMLRLAAEHGLRRGEIVLVHTRNDVIQDLVGWSLMVHGKGRKQRLVPLLDDVAAMLLALPPGWAFPGAVDGHMSPRWCGILVSRLLPGEWTTHKLRHKAATEWWEASGEDLARVGDMLGHASLDTTRRYVLDRTALARRREIVNAAAAAAADRRRPHLRSA